MMNSSLVLRILFALLIATVSWAKPAHVEDPYATIEFIQLENGVKVILAPSSLATKVKIKIEVDTGIDAESPENWGVAHLLEHVLFRDKQLKDEMSFLQLIKENGGSANGSTQHRITDYYATIPHEKGVWLFETLTKMILEPEIHDEYVQKEKATVELERGRPSPIVRLLGRDILDIIEPPYLKLPTYNESEFGISLKSPYTLAQEQLATQRLTADQVRHFYQEYYHSANMRVYIAGRFDRDAMMNIVRGKWAQLERREGKILPPLPKPKPRLEPYLRTTHTNGTPQITIGTKLWDLQAGDVELVDSYMEYLAHRLMKEIRNKKGQTYSASAYTSGWNGFGYSTISLQTSREHFSENLEIVKKYLDEEATLGALTNEQVQEAKRLYLDMYRLYGRDADEMMAFADRFYADLRDYGSYRSPYQIVKEITVEQYNETLKKYFAKERRYIEVQAPALFFEYDHLVFLGVFTFVLAIFLRQRLTRPFSHDQVRWIRKLRYPPLKILELIGCVFTTIVFMHLNYVLGALFRSSSFLQGSLFFSQYMHSCLQVLLAFGAAQLFLSVMPRKIMVVDDKLMIKSLSYFSHSIPLHEIAKVEASKPRLKAFPRFYWFDPVFWRRGLYIELHNGRSYYFSMSDAEKAKNELLSFVAKAQLSLRQVS